MSKVYTEKLKEHALNVASYNNLSLQRGVYAAVSGPTYMSGAELIMLRNLGGDVVGMSTVPEAIVARHMNMNVLGISCITDMAIGEAIEGITHEEVMEVAKKTKPVFISFVKSLLKDANEQLWEIAEEE